MKKPTIFIYEAESTVGKRTVISKIGIVKESLLQSIISDIFTFTVILVSFWINYQFIHSRVLSLFLLIGFLTSANVTSKRQVTKEEFKEKIKKYI